MNRKKISYTISDGIGPYKKSCLLDDITKSNSFFSIPVDETPDSEKRVNQIDVIIRYYSEKDKKSCSAPLQRDEPLIHILYDALIFLTKIVMGCFLKPDAYADKTVFQVSSSK